MKHCDKIMIVEDDAGICRYLQSTLAAAGYDTVAVGDGRSALALIASHCPDCVLLDLGLPDMDGVDVIKKFETGQPCQLQLLVPEVRIKIKSMH